MLREESQAQKANVPCGSIIGHHPGKGKTIRTEIISVLVIGQGGLTAKGHKATLGKCSIL